MFSNGRDSSTAIISRRSPVLANVNTVRPSLS